MRVSDAGGALIALHALGQRLETLGTLPVPILVVRLPALERTAWREGRPKARHLEKRASAAFAAAAARVLRAEDLVAHDPASDVFVAALTTPTRDGVFASASLDVRSALARIAATMETVTRLDVATGWTSFTATQDARDMHVVVERALLRGAQERERYAFFSALGHELRTPLSSIRGYLETLLDPAIDERTRARFLLVAYNESLRLSRLVEGMFEISLLDLHATFPSRASGSLTSAFDAAIDACAARAAARSVTIRRAPVRPTMVAMDVDRLTLVLINVIDNAIKHGREGGTIEIGVDLSDPLLVRLTIDDDGPGIDPAQRERMFSLGERGTTGASGSGIGLAFVRLMLERTGGRVNAGAAPLGGARFSIDVPRHAHDPLPSR